MNYSNNGIKELKRNEHRLLRAVKTIFASYTPFTRCRLLVICMSIEKYVGRLFADRRYARKYIFFFFLRTSYLRT